MEKASASQLSPYYYRPQPVDPSHAQRMASNPDVSVWVSASAGSGKTKVLAERVLRLLLSGASPQRIVCLTYTKAAAAEMSARLTQRLTKWASCSDEDLLYDLDELQGRPPSPEQPARARCLLAIVLGTPGGLRLKTIHAFCQEILARFPLEAGIAPSFTLIEETESALLRKEALDETIIESSVAQHPELRQALARLSIATSNSARLDDVINKVTTNRRLVAKSIARYRDIDGIRAAQLGYCGLRSDEDEDKIIQRAVNDDAFARDDLLKAARMMIEQKASKSFHERACNIISWINLSAQERFINFNVWKSIFLTKGSGNPIMKLVPGAKYFEPFFDECDNILRLEAQRLVKIVDDLDAVKHINTTHALLKFASAVEEKYTQLKSHRAALDFDDVITHACRLLSSPERVDWVLYKLDGGLDHLLLDEAQDTSEDQWQIARALTAEFFSGHGASYKSGRTLFVVGDEKQSIFGFRGADPALFNDQLQQLSKHVANDEMIVVPINTCFRSAPAILRVVDSVFADDYARSGVSKEAINHNAWRTQAAGTVELAKIVSHDNDAGKSVGKINQKTSITDDADAADNAKDTDNNNDDNGEENTDDENINTKEIQEFANQLAAKISGWINGGLPIMDRSTGEWRNAKAGDILILLKRRGKLADSMLRALQRIDVPVAGIDRLRLLDHIGVRDVLAAVRFMLLPEDDLNLAVLLRSCIIGAEEDDIIKLASKRTGTLWQSLIDNRHINADYAAWHDWLLDMLNMADFMPPLTVITHILQSPCPADAISGKRALARRLGNEIADPIDELLNAAESVQRRIGHSLQAFITELDTINPEIKRNLAHSSDTVRVMTVHNAKGLEAPVVVLADAARNYKPDKTNLLMDEKTCLPFWLCNKPINKQLSALLEAKKTLEEEESRRLLYVAMTRAESFLYVTGMPKNNKTNGTWYHFISQGIERIDGKGATFHADKTLSYGDNPFATTRNSENSIQANIPAWARAHAIDETTPAASRPSASAVLAPDDPRRLRGRVIHRLLEILPKVDKSLWHDTISRALCDPALALNADDQKQLNGEVSSLLDQPQMQIFLGENSLAEVEIAGEIDGKTVIGRLDRIAMHETHIDILDYKTSREAKNSAAATKQVRIYMALAQKIWPHKKIRGFIISVRPFELQEISIN